MLAHVTGLLPGELVWNGGDVHIYHNHFDQMREQLGRKPLPSPILRINRQVPDIDSFQIGDFDVIGYEHLGAIKAPIAV
jgi:thymidylate synthase